jgi:hypothetical protein
MISKAVLLSLLMVLSLFWISTNADADEITHDRAIKLVRQAYCRVLEGPADESGLVTYASKLERGEMTAKELVRTLAKSREHQKRFFLNNTPRRFSAILIDHVLAPLAGADVKVIKREILNKLIYSGVHAAIDHILQSGQYKFWWKDYKIPGLGRRGCQ